MLPAKNRLKLSKRNHGKFASKITGPDFIVRYKKAKGPFKAAVVVPKAAAKKAVDRNRIKRIITEALRQTPKEDISIIVIVKKNIANLKTQEVKIKLTDLLGKI